MQEIPHDIVIDAAKGDIEAFEKIYKTASGYVYNIAYRIVNKREKAEEITQDVFIKIYDKLKYFQFRSAIKTWIYRITVNEAINANRKMSKESDKKTEFDEEILYKLSTDIIKERLDKEENEILIKRLLNFLNPKQRACIVLRDIEGLSYREMSNVLKININTVRSRLKRAREALLNAVQRGVV